MIRSTYPLDMKPLRLRLGKAEAGSVDKEAWDAQQLHGCPSQAGGDHVVDKESAIVWEKNTPVRGAEGERMLTQMAKRAAGGCHWVLLLAREVQELPVTHWNLILASSRKWMSKSQRKKRSRLQEKEEQLRKGGPTEQHGVHLAGMHFPLPWVGETLWTLHCQRSPFCHTGPPWHRCLPPSQL